MNPPSEIAIPRISVVIPVYNVAAYVEEAIASIQTQTIRDIEIIVVDDGSTDQTPQLIRGIAEQDSRVCILNMPARGGHGSAAARNFGLTVCRAPYIAVMDGDDISTPDRLERQIRFLETHPEVSLVSCAIRMIDEAGRLGEKVYAGAPTEAAIMKTCCYGNPCFHFWVAKREVYERLCGYRLMPCDEDYDFVLRALSEGFRVSNLAEPLYWYRSRRGNTTSRAGIETYLTHYYVIHLYRERITRGVDSFCPPDLAKATHASHLRSALHAISVRYSERANNSHETIERYLCRILSIVVAPWLAREYWAYLVNRYIYDREKKRLETVNQYEH